MTPTTNQELEQKIELTIIDLSSDGRGLARHEGKVYFAGQTAPGDVIQTTKIDHKSSFANVLEYSILKESQARTTPRCRFSSECGGCNWMHIAYPEQIGAKESILRNHFARIAKESALPPIQILKTENKVWRHRLRIHVEKQGDFFNLGLYKKNSKEIIDIDECTICSETINVWLKAIQGTKINLGIPSLNSFDLQLDIVGEKLNIWPSKIKTSDKKLDLNTLTQKIMAHLKSKSKELGIGIITLPIGFQQSNPEINTLIQKTLSSEMEPSEHMLELYCGSGNMTKALATSTTNIVGVEQNLKSPDRSIKNAKYINQSVEKYLASSTQSKDKLADFDAIFLNPPRIGAKNIIPYFKHIQAKQLSYLSCNSATLARDLSKIKEAQPGWEIKKIFLFDMFPETHHFETLVTMQRS